MDAQLRSMLNETEQALLRAVQPRELKRLDEDALTALHDRIRRARNKYSKLYRRRASDRVASDRSRSRASAANAKSRSKGRGIRGRARQGVGTSRAGRRCSGRGTEGRAPRGGTPYAGCLDQANGQVGDPRCHFGQEQDSNSGE